MTECGRDSSDGIATGYGLVVPRIELRLGRDFPEKIQPDPEATQSPIRGVSGLLPRDKEDGYAADHSPPYSAEFEYG
jgi:hypothetical protein